MDTQKETKQPNKIICKMGVKKIKKMFHVVYQFETTTAKQSDDDYIYRKGLNRALWPTTNTDRQHYTEYNTTTALPKPEQLNQPLVMKQPFSSLEEAKREIAHSRQTIDDFNNSEMIKLYTIVSR